MKKRFFRFLPALLMICALLQPVWVSAAEPTGSITLEYSHNGIAFSDLDIGIYRVAEFDPDGDYRLVAPFDGFPVNIQGITSQREWKDAANTLVSYALANQLRPDHRASTDGSGMVTFSDLDTGVYLICGVTADDHKHTYRFENFFLILPTPQSDGTFLYDLIAKPKCSVTEKPEKPQEIDYRVVKLWKDAGNRSGRPASITVDILRNGVVWETVKLSPDNNWTYRWSAPADAGIWSVVEKDVPDTYRVAITANGNVFQITNTDKSPSAPPQTGDTSSPWLYMIMMCLSGFGLLILGMPTIRRGRHEKDR